MEVCWRQGLDAVADHSACQSRKADERQHGRKTMGQGRAAARGAAGGCGGQRRRQNTHPAQPAQRGGCEEQPCRGEHRAPAAHCGTECRQPVSRQRAEGHRRGVAHAGAHGLYTGQAFDSETQKRRPHSGLRRAVQCPNYSHKAGEEAQAMARFSRPEHSTPENTMRTGSSLSPANPQTSWKIPYPTKKPLLTRPSSLCEKPAAARDRSQAGREVETADISAEIGCPAQREKQVLPAQPGDFCGISGVVQGSASVFFIVRLPARGPPRFISARRTLRCADPPGFSRSDCPGRHPGGKADGDGAFPRQPHAHLRDHIFRRGDHKALAVRGAGSVVAFKMAVPGLCDICFGEDKLAHGLEYLMHIVVAGGALRHRAAHGGVAGDLRVRRRGPPAADHRHVFLADGALRMSARHPALRRGGFIPYKNTCLPLGGRARTPSAVCRQAPSAVRRRPWRSCRAPDIALRP